MLYLKKKYHPCYKKKYHPCYKKEEDVTNMLDLMIQYFHTEKDLDDIIDTSDTIFSVAEGLKNIWDNYSDILFLL